MQRSGGCIGAHAHAPGSANQKLIGPSGHEIGIGVVRPDEGPFIAVDIAAADLGGGTDLCKVPARETPRASGHVELPAGYDGQRTAGSIAIAPADGRYTSAGGVVLTPADRGNSGAGGV